jgi:hypothetical protein
MACLCKGYSCVLRGNRYTPQDSVDVFSCSHCALLRPCDSRLQQQQRERENPRSRWAQQRAGVHKIAGTAGRTFTSRFRGVHQTFPTKRWEAQFRRNGKPTSLGCFDQVRTGAAGGWYTSMSQSFE